MRIANVLRFTGAVIATVLVAGTAQAQLFRAYLSPTGNDANNCTLPTPCRLLPAALTAVAEGGEIWMLGSANYNAASVTVTKSVTILALPGVVASLLAIGNASALVANNNANVVLRNLVITNLPGNASGHGIEANGASVTVEDSLIHNLPGLGIYAASSNLSMRNTVIRGNGSYGIWVAASTAMLDKLHVEGNAGGGLMFYAQAVTATLNSSVVSSNGTTGTIGVRAENWGGNPSSVTIRDCVIRGHDVGISNYASGGGTLDVRATHNTIVENGVGVDGVEFTANLSILLEANTVAGNNIGIRNQGGALGTINFYTASNNVVTLNPGGDVQGGLTPISPQYR